MPSLCVPASGAFETNNYPTVRTDGRYGAIRLFSVHVYSDEADSLAEVAGESAFEKLFTNDFFAVVFSFLSALLRLLAKVSTEKAQ